MLLVVEKLDRVGLHPEGQTLEEGDVVGEHFFVPEIKLEADEFVDEVV